MSKTSAETTPLLTADERIGRLENIANTLMGHASQLQGAVSLLIFLRSVDVIAASAKKKILKLG